LAVPYGQVIVAINMHIINRRGVPNRKMGRMHPFHRALDANRRLYGDFSE